MTPINVYHILKRIIFRYKENAMKRSHIMKDKPLAAKELVNYWVEYVIRHQGASHLRVASLNLEWYQYLLLDVAIFVSAMIFALFHFMRFMFKYLLKNKKNLKEKRN